jgi:hypothetical protein
VRLNYTFIDHDLSSARQLSGNSSKKTYFFWNIFHDHSQMFFEVEFVVNLDSQPGNHTVMQKYGLIERSAEKEPRKIQFFES